MTELFSFLQGVQPIGVIALLGLIIYMLVKSRQDKTDIVDNHLHELPEILESLKRIEVKLDKMSDGITYLKAKSNEK